MPAHTQIYNPAPAAAESQRAASKRKRTLEVAAPEIANLKIKRSRIRFRRRKSATQGKRSASFSVVDAVA